MIQQMLAIWPLVPLPFLNPAWQSESEVTQSCPTLCNPMERSLPGCSIHGIFQTRILQCVAISFSRRSSQPRDWTWVSCTVGRFFTVWATREVPNPAWTSAISWFKYCWCLALKIFEHNPSSMWNWHNCIVFWTFFGIALFWDWNESWLFPVLWPLLSFPNLLTYWVQHLHGIIF